MTEHIFADEVMLMAWGESDTQGPWIKVRLPSSEHLEPFRGMTKAKGDKAGQRLGVVMVEIADDETIKPVEKRKGGAISELLGRWCTEEPFQRWIMAVFDDIAVDVLTTAKSNTHEWITSEMVRRICGVKSRADIDHDPEAERIFWTKIHAPYMASRGLGRAG